MSTRCFIGLGGNEGPVASTFDRALDLLEAGGRARVVKISSRLRTKAVGEHSGNPFLNAAAELSTDLEPIALLYELQLVEVACGRKRDLHWGPRTLDLDLLLYGEMQLELPELTIPHPAVWHRRFALDPLAEIAPDVRHPERKATIAQLRERLLIRPLTLLLCNGAPPLRAAIKQQVEADFPEVMLLPEPALPEATLDAKTIDRLDPTFCVWLGRTAAGGDGPAQLAYADLPRRSRANATRGPHPPEKYVRYVLQSALS